ncbi:alpha-taxilin-like isoform X1 [Salvia splendens]|uniref:alpha-taxilin-like isoform X1 n=1 Tax=Salvia splendens TaxID=180675 RepID=UPI0011033315|nr:alpha-taxilin-like isoform X1 [Salvia splendens]XP_042036512.1 alpha-taxilin-like isoform X1 [Salvia splendens]
MGDPNPSQNPEANQLPEADSLPDGFVESSTAEEEVDYKEEKLLEPGSRPEVVIEDGGSSLGKLVEHVADQTQSAAAAQGDVNAKDKSVEDAQAHTVTSVEIAGTGTTENNKKEAPEVKRKIKRTFKSEKEYLEFTLKFQQVLTERDSAVAVRDKLESLCRELQRQNKMLMDECKRVSNDGQNLRLDLSNKFQDAIKEVSCKLEEQKDECIAQLKENEMLKIKLKQLVEQYTLSEQQHAQQLKQKALELQLSDLKLQQQEEKLKQEQAQMKLYAEQVAQLLGTEKNLRLQLTADGEKFQQFQEALLKSNEVFETFKQEIEKMAKSIKDLKKENTFMKSKSEKSDITLIELANERELLKKQLEKTRNQKDKLELLCRSLQAERKTSSVASNSSDIVL